MFMEIFGFFLFYFEFFYIILVKIIYWILFMIIIDIVSSIYVGEISRLMYVFLFRFKNCCGLLLYFLSYCFCFLLFVFFDSICDDN